MTNYIGTHLINTGFAYLAVVGFTLITGTILAVYAANEIQKILERK